VGSIESYKTAKGKRYRVRYRDPDRRSKERGGFQRKIEAEEFLASVTVQQIRGEYIDPSESKVTVGTLGAEWIANQTHLKPASFSVVETAWRLHVEPVWGNRRLGEIRHSEVQSWLTRFAANDGNPRSATLVTRAYGVLAAILDVAVRDRRIAANPARGVKLPRKTKKRRAYLTPAQIELLASESGSHASLIYFLSYTGVRWGEATALRVRSIDAERRRALISENAVWVRGKIALGTPKSHEHRSVPYPKFLSEHLMAQSEGKGPDGLIFGNGLTHQVPPKVKTGWFSYALRRAQLQDPTFPVITLHDLRHTAASLAISAGANPKAVQRMLGHASAAMTLDTYADLFEDDLDAVSDRLDSMRSKAVVGDLWGIHASATEEPPKSQ
jgi:integrase